FDEGGLVTATTAKLFRHRQTKGAETDMPSLRSQQPALYSTLFAPSPFCPLFAPFLLYVRKQQ
ncbi:MAG: hypothetical protein RBT64_07115, partial [Trichloromonas sp.]|nr:hypothetical protein [Trichloromonas sp.]